MKLGTIPDPFAGEKIADLFPKISPYVLQEPRLGRLHYFPGRHLTEFNLSGEQTIRDTRLALRGQAVTSGIVSGLEVSWRDVGSATEIIVQPGQAILDSGEDVVVDRIIAAQLGDLALIGPNPSGAPTTAYAAILVLQTGRTTDADLPLAAQVEEYGPDFTPAPRSVDDEIYYRKTYSDAARLALYILPPNQMDGQAWRNRLAWDLFGLEAQNKARPWLEAGVPLAVIAFDRSRRPLFVDRHAVARTGGRPRVRILAYPELDARSWQARFDQFCAHLSDLPAPVPAVAEFQYLPPIGLLPKAHFDLGSKGPGLQPGTLRWMSSQSFFPENYAVGVAVVPTEQLDALIASHRSLAPYEVGQADSVLLLLPVSQQWFDPALLNIEIIDQQFAQAVSDFRDVRADKLAQRYDLANRRRVLEKSIDGTFTPYPLNYGDDDPKRLENPEKRGDQATVSVPPGAAVQSDTTRTGPSTSPGYTSDILTRIRAAADAFIKEFSKEDIDEFGKIFEACGLPREAKAGKDKEKESDYDKVSKWLGENSWIKTVSEKGTDPALEEADKVELRRELIAYIEKQSQVQADENKQADSASLQGLIDYFEAKADEADELVESGFLKVRTDVYRLGQLLNNNSLGTKFAASPSLANIIERKPAKADTAGVNNFASQLIANFAPSKVALASQASGGTTMTVMMRSLSNVGASGIPNLGVDNAKLDAAITRLSKRTTAEDKEALLQVQKAVGFLQSPSNQATLDEVKQTASFADNFVENFNQLSHKQIRAIPLDRLEPALAPTIRQEIHDGRLEVFERLTRMNISLGDLTTDFVDTPDHIIRPEPSQIKTLVRLRFHSLITRRFDSLSRITTTKNDTTVVEADESKHFSTGVSYADMAQAALRAVEKRIKEYRAFVATCRDAIAQTSTRVTEFTTALAPVEIELDESRQDVAIALALMAEEQARLDAINAHREKILREHVEFLVYHRPRAVTAITPVASRPLEDALLTDPVLDCFRLNPPAPPDLAALREPFRGSPAKWFLYAPAWLDKVDLWEHMRALLERSYRLPSPVFSQTSPFTPGRYQGALDILYQSRQAAVERHFATYKIVAPALLPNYSWLDLKREAQSKLTLDHLLTAGPAHLARAAAEELDHIFVVATSLHDNFSHVPGLVRLSWAERFSQFDQVSVDFRDLSRLPNWHRLDFNLQRELRILTDWLYGRIDQNVPEALELIHDLVRVAMLLASHAPVDQLIIGQPLEENIRPEIGGFIKLKVDPMRIRQGMTVTHQIGANLILKAVVEDISASHVSARVIEMPTQSFPNLTSSSSFYFR